MSAGSDVSESYPPPNLQNSVSAQGAGGGVRGGLEKKAQLCMCVQTARPASEQGTSHAEQGWVPEQSPRREWPAVPCHVAG